MYWSNRCNQFHKIIIIHVQRNMFLVRRWNQQNKEWIKALSGFPLIGNMTKWNSFRFKLIGNAERPMRSPVFDSERMTSLMLNGLWKTWKNGWKTTPTVYLLLQMIVASKLTDKLMRKHINRLHTICRRAPWNTENFMSCPHRERRQSKFVAFSIRKIWFMHSILRHWNTKTCNAIHDGRGDG